MLREKFSKENEEKNRKKKKKRKPFERGRGVVSRFFGKILPAGWRFWQKPVGPDLFSTQRLAEEAP